MLKKTRQTNQYILTTFKLQLKSNNAKSKTTTTDNYIGY